MVKLDTFIVDKRNLVFLLTIIGLVFSAFSRNWVEVENDLTYYLPDDPETKQALNVMEEQFTTYGTAEVMVANLHMRTPKSSTTSCWTSRACSRSNLTRRLTITRTPRRCSP